MNATLLLIAVIALLSTKTMAKSCYEKLAEGLIYTQSTLDSYHLGCIDEAEERERIKRGISASAGVYVRSTYSMAHNISKYESSCSVLEEYCPMTIASLKMNVRVSHATPSRTSYTSNNYSRYSSRSSSSADNAVSGAIAVILLILVLILRCCCFCCCGGEDVGRSSTPVYYYSG